MERLNIVCIDDQENVLYTLQRDLTLFQSDLNLSFCGSASEACQVLEELESAGRYIAIVICDHIMPDQNGIDFLIELKEDERFSKIKTILLTGLATHQGLPYAPLIRHILTDTSKSPGMVKNSSTRSRHC
ncbi:MAG: response regulator [candidate division KSB1 bacterium]|nr:response regulator [candidate division KSB1 bacterium]